MARITEENIELLERFVAFVVTLVSRQKATEIALTKLGLSDEQWNDVLNEALRSLNPLPLPLLNNEHSLEEYLAQLEGFLRNP